MILEYLWFAQHATSSTTSCNPNDLHALKQKTQGPPTAIFPWPLDSTLKSAVSHQDTGFNQLKLQFAGGGGGSAWFFGIALLGGSRWCVFTPATRRLFEGFASKIYRIPLKLRYGIHMTIILGTESPLRMVEFPNPKNQWSFFVTAIWKKTPWESYIPKLLKKTTTCDNNKSPRCKWFIMPFQWNYCWWKKSCTTWDV